MRPEVCSERRVIPTGGSHDVAGKHSEDLEALMTTDALGTETHHEDPLRGSKGEKS